MMSDSRSLTNDAFYTIEIHCEAKGYHECTFQVEIGEQFLAMQKFGNKGRAFKDFERSRTTRSSRARPRRPVVAIQKISVVSISIKQYREFSRLYILCFININIELLYNNKLFATPTLQCRNWKPMQ